MKHLNTSHPPRLHQLVRQLLLQIDVERVYLRKINPETPKEELIILIPKFGKKELSQLNPLVNILFESEPLYTYRLYFASKVKDFIHQGNLRFYTICAEENLLYQRPMSDFHLFPVSTDVKGLLKKAERNFEKEMEKINAFNQGAQLYMDNKHLGPAAFMLQQAIELSYRAMELWEVGVDKVSHRIAGHQQYMGTYISALGRLFHKEVKEDVVALSLLDDAYLDTRYKINYHISLEQLQLCQEKAKNLASWLPIIYKRMVSAFKEGDLAKKSGAAPAIELGHPTQEKAMPEQGTEASRPEMLSLQKDEKNAKVNYAQQIVEELTAKLSIDSIYCFGLRSEIDFRDSLLGEHKTIDHHHYDLLLISDEEVAAVAQIEGNINAAGLPYSVTLITHSRLSIEKALQRNNRFFHMVLRKSDHLYGKPEPNEIKLSGGEDNYDKTAINMVWFHRNSRARGFLSTAKTALDEGYDGLPVSLLNQSLEQACLGLIYVFLGYTPNRYRLHHLLNLCDNFTALTKDVFPRRTDDDLDLFRNLNQSVCHIRYLHRGVTNPIAINTLIIKVEVFLERAELLAKAFLASEEEEAKVA